MLALKPFRRIERGLPDYLNWSHIVAPGIVLCKDGSLLAGRYFRGANLAHKTDVQWEAASAAANRALCKLGGGWSVWIDAIRLPASRFTEPADNHFPCEIAAIIEAERRETLTAEGACLESEYAVILHYMPPLKRQGAVVNLIYDQDKETRTSAASAILDGFRKTVAEFDDQLSAAVRVWPMADRRWTDERGQPQLRSDLVNYLHFCVSGELLDIPLPPNGCYLDGIIGEKPVFPGNMPKIGDMFAACVSISGYPFPGSSTPGVLTSIDTMTFPLRWSTRYIVLDQPEAAKQGKIIETKWKQKARGFKGIFFDDAKEDPDASKMSADAADAIERTQSAIEGTGYYTSTIVLMDEDPDVLAERVREIRRAIRGMGYPTREETINAMDALLGTYPSHCIPNVRRPPIHTTNLADLLPLSAPWQGEEHNPCPLYPATSPPLMQAVTAGATPINVSFHVGDVGHVVGFGPIGSGKSTLLATTALSALRYAGAMVWAFDKGRALMPTFRAVGKYYDIANDNLSFCPLSVLDTEADVAWAEDWIATCFHLQTGADAKPHHTTAIHHAIALMRAGTGRSITHFLRLVQDHDVREAMGFYALGGTLGHMTDAETDGLEDGLVRGFEIAELMGMGERSLIPILHYLFRRFQKSLKGQPAYLLLDEAWTMLGHPVWHDKLREWLKELRKANCAVVMATQSLSDATRSGLLDVLLESCPFRFFGANPAAMTNGEDGEPGPRQFYQKFGLTDAQIELIRHAMPKRHYLIDCPDGSALIDLRLGRTALKFVGAGSKTDLARIDKLFREHGDNWVKHWLETA